MAILLLPVGSDGQAYNDANGNPRSGAKLFVYLANTSTKATIYQNLSGTTTHTNPIILNSAGQVSNGSGAVKPIFADSGLTYDMVLAPSTDTDPPASPYFTLEDLSTVNDVTTSVDLGSNDTISGNTSVAAGSFNSLSGLSNVSASAVITLPAANTVAAGLRRRFRSQSTGNIYLQRTGADTIDGATTFRIPSFTTIEVTSDNVSVWQVTMHPAYYVGQTIEGGMTAPPGFIAADGSAISRTTYAGLFAVQSTSFGIGDGSTTFNVQDRRSRASIGAGTGTLAESAADGSWTNSGGGLAMAVTSNIDKWITGMEVVPTSTDTLPTGLTNPAFVVRTSATSLNFATSLANALAGTLIAFTDDGTGTHTITHTLSARTLGQKVGQEAHADTIAELPVHTHVNTLVFEARGFEATGGTYTTIAANATETITAVGNGSSPTFNNISAAFTSNISNANTGSSTAHNIMDPKLVVNVFVKT